jgi:hypothetical protein
MAFKVFEKMFLSSTKAGVSTIAEWDISLGEKKLKLNINEIEDRLNVLNEQFTTTMN